MRLRLPRGLFAKQLAAPLLALVAAGSVWVWVSVYFFGQVHAATDARFAASRLRQRILEARFSAQTFLARDIEDPRFFLGVPLPAMEDFSHAVSEAGDRIAAIERLRPQDRAATEPLRALVEKYQAAFLKVTELHRRQGYAEWGLEGDWEKALRDAELVLAGRPDLMLELLEIRRSEKDYLRRREPPLLEPARLRLATLREVRGLAPAAAGRLRLSLDRYRAALEEYAAIDRQIGVGSGAGLRAEMTQTAQQMEPIVRTLYEDAIRGAAAARRRLGIAIALALVAGLLLGGAVSYAFARWVSPLFEDRPAAAVGIGDETLDPPAETAGDHEIADLGRAVLAGTADAVFVKDLTGRYVLVNAACATFMGRTIDEVVGRDNRELLAPETAAVIDENEQRLLSTGTTLTYEVADDKQRTFLTTKGVLRDAQGVIKGLFAISRDISERKQAEEATRAARAAAGAVARSKGELLAHLSREIRTPMNAVIGTAQRLLDTDLQPEQREQAITVRESAEALLTILDEVLDFSRVEAGRVDLREQPFRLEDVVAGAVRPLASCAHEKTLELAFRIDPGVPETMIGDAGRLRQVLMNLVANAVKFTERGEVLVSVDAFDLGQSQSLLRVLVADTGIGVPAEVRPAIFEPFVQADRSPRRAFGGAGLGLAISSRLATLMGGRIEVDEAPGGGSVFTFTARLRVAEGNPARPEVADLQGLAVLVVDDNAICRKVVLERLAGWGMRGVGAASEPAALAAMTQAREAGDSFAVAIVEAELPDGGFALARRLAEDGLPGRVLLMLPPDGAGADRAQEAGLAWLLQKPIQPSTLLEGLQRALAAPRSGPAEPG